jgi:hypothetical protein
MAVAATVVAVAGAIDLFQSIACQSELLEEPMHGLLDGFSTIFLRAAYCRRALLPALFCFLKAARNSMNTRHYHTPITDPQRKRCPICDKPVYSLAGIHPQCAIKQNEGIVPVPIQEADGSVAVVAARTNALGKPLPA